MLALSQRCTGGVGFYHVHRAVDLLFPSRWIFLPKFVILSTNLFRTVDVLRAFLKHRAEIVVIIFVWREFNPHPLPDDVKHAVECHLRAVRSLLDEFGDLRD